MSERKLVKANDGSVYGVDEASLITREELVDQKNKAQELLDYAAKRLDEFDAIVAPHEPQAPVQEPVDSPAPAPTPTDIATEPVSIIVEPTPIPQPAPQPVPESLDIQ